MEILVKETILIYHLRQACNTIRESKNVQHMQGYALNILFFLSKQIFEHFGLLLHLWTKNGE